MIRTDWTATLETWHELQSEVDALRMSRNAVGHSHGHLYHGGYFHTYTDVRESLDELLPAMQWYADLFKEALTRQLDAQPLQSYAISPIAGNYVITVSTHSGGGGDG